MPFGRRFGVTLTQARQPPAAGFNRLRRILHVDNAIDLMVARVAGLIISGSRTHMHVAPIAEPQLMNAARMRARRIEKGYALRVFRLRNIEQIKSRRLLPDLGGLIGNRHDVAANLKRVGPHILHGEIRLHHHLGLTRIGDIDRGEILRRLPVREPQDAPAVRRDLKRHALAEAAEAI